MSAPSPTPNAQEQLLLEYLNLLRMDPGGEFDRLIANAATGAAVQTNITNALSYFGVSLDAFRSQMMSYPAAAPMAWNTALAAAAEGHTRLMIEMDMQSHRLPGEPGLSARITDAGYTNWTSVHENVFAYAQDPLYGHAGFVIDWGHDSEDRHNGALLPNWRTLGDGIQDPPSHRLAMLSPQLTEVGMAMFAETDPSTSVGPFLITQNFGARWDYVPQLLGVVIHDADNDSFYDIGEGLAGVTVTARGTAGIFTTTSWSSGGYQMELPAGSYSVSFAGGMLGEAAVYNVTIGTQNVKLDAFSRDAGASLRLAGTAGSDTLSGQGGNDILYGDGFRAAYAMDDARAVYRLYQATLDRAPDVAGQLGWTERLAEGTRSLQEVAAGFVNSPEFQNVYGALGNAAFVDLLYQNVLGRAADAGGLAGWVGRLEAGTARAQVVTGFSESTEFRTATNAAATRFTLERDPATWTDDVYRLYQATLARDPDLAGLTTWAGRLAEGTRSLQEVAAGFVGSPEFQNVYGALGNAAFVDLLYQNVLGRAADAGGLAGWLAQLDGGTARAQVVLGFSQSAEFTTATAPGLTQWVRAQGVHDVLEGGGGTNNLYGGIMADEFRFAANDNGTHRLHDFEAWDYLTFRGFGYAEDAQALARMTQQGADVVFADQGVTVILLNTQLAQITEDSIWI